MSDLTEHDFEETATGYRCRACGLVTPRPRIGRCPARHTDLDSIGGSIHSEAVRRQVARALEVVAMMLRDFKPIAKVRCESNDHWLILDVWVEDPTFPPENTEPRKFAIWLETTALYRVGADGAVEDDPIAPVEAL